MTWQRVGQTGVDAGIILITDACYVIRDPEERPYEPFRSYRGHFLPELEQQEKTAGVPRGQVLNAYQMTNEYGAAVGVVVGNFGGDGVFPVYIEKDARGQVIGAMIRFDGEDPK